MVSKKPSEDFDEEDKESCDDVDEYEVSFQRIPSISGSNWPQQSNSSSN